MEFRGVLCGLHFLLMTLMVQEALCDVRSDDSQNNSMAVVTQSAALSPAEEPHPNKFATWTYQGPQRTLPQLHITKRAPNGFIGMRGKKANEEGGWPQLSSEEHPDYDDLSVDKKASNAFYGVRGKKYSDEMMYLNNVVQHVNAERVRDMLLQDFLGRLAVSNMHDNDIAKRAPTGFTGMRGKRPAYVQDDEDDSDDNEMFEENEMNKRAPSGAFVGVRGKKEDTHQYSKRSPAESIGPRSKQQRFIDFGNKFVAVRGKKSDGTPFTLPYATYPRLREHGPDDNLSWELTAPLPLTYDGNDQAESFRPNQAPRQLRYIVNMLPSMLYGSNGKRTPNGFLGMRGKRSAPETFKFAPAHTTDGVALSGGH